jgi:hypothetical protein
MMENAQPNIENRSELCRELAEKIWNPSVLLKQVAR